MANATELLSGAKVLEIFHNTPRFGRPNDFIFPVPVDQIVAGEFEFSPAGDFFNSDKGDYYVGALANSIFLGVIFFAWLLALPFTRCWKVCQCKCCSNNVKLGFFMFFMIVSILGWFVSIMGNLLLQQGIKDGLDNGDKMELNMDVAAEKLAAILDLRPTVDQLSITAEDACSRPGFDFSGTLPRGSDLDVLEEPQEIFSDGSDEIENVRDNIEPTVNRFSRAYKALIVCIIFFLGLFSLTTCFTFCYNRRMKHKNLKEKHWVAEANDCLNKCGCKLIFTIGMVFLLCIVALCLLIAPLATVGADLCTPDPNQNLLSEFAKGTDDLAFDFCEVQGNYDDLNDVERIGSFICHYSECRGRNIIFDIADIEVEDVGNGTLDITIGAIEEAKNSISTARTLIALAEAGGEDMTDCESAIDDLEGLVSTIEGFGVDGVSLFTCQELTPLYTETMNENGCNGIIAGLGIIFITWMLGILGMMFAMFLYILIEYEEIRFAPKPIDLDYIEANPTYQSTGKRSTLNRNRDDFNGGGGNVLQLTRRTNVQLTMISVTANSKTPDVKEAEEVQVADAQDPRVLETQGNYGAAAQGEIVEDIPKYVGVANQRSVIDDPKYIDAQGGDYKSTVSSVKRQSLKSTMLRNVAPTVLTTNKYPRVEDDEDF